MQRTEKPAEWPQRGNRRRLEAEWLTELERHGLTRFLPEAPRRGPPELYKGIDQFNGGAFWDCHETLEDVWLSTPYPLRFFYHSIIKVAVGFYHMGRHNRHGTRVKLADGVRLLRIFLPAYMEVDTRHLLDDGSAWLARVDSDEPLDWTELDGLPRPTIRLL